MAAVFIPATPNNINLKTTDQVDNEYETNLNKGFGPPMVSTYNYVNQVARALNGLTTNVYRDSIVVMSKSVNEALLEGVAAG